MPLKPAAPLVLVAVLSSTAAAQTEAPPPINLMVFGDASFLWTERDVAEGFSLGQVVGHLTAALAPRVTVTTEGTVTSLGSGPVATLERLIIRYDFSDALKVSAGRYHTPIAWWNTRFHHGLWLQTSIDRPRLVRFGTPLIPVHFTGVLAEGIVPVGGSTVVYEAGLGNGRQPNLITPGDAGDANGSLAAVGALRLRPAVLPHLELGVHAYLDEADSEGGPVAERIIGGHAVWLANPELVVEYLHFIHDPEDGPAPSTSSDAFYAQAGWTLPVARALQPYVRYEVTDTEPGDPLFSGLGLDYDGIIGGIRWDFTDYAALKAELRSEEFAALERATSFVLNASFVIPNILQ